MQASTNYIYIIFAVAYAIYSMVKAGKKVTQNRPTIDQDSEQKETTSPTVQPPTASPVPTPGDEMRKMLEDLLGGRQEAKIPETPKLKPEPVSIKPHPTKIVTHAIKEKAMPLHMPSKTHHETPKPFLVSEEGKTKQVFNEVVAEEESAVDFDFRQAIIYSEILKRPQY